MKDDLLMMGGIALAIFCAGWYLKNAAGRALTALGDAAAQAVTTATEPGALNVGGTIQALQDNSGMTQDQATQAELLALGGMGA